MTSFIENNEKKIALIECPRDAMQGWPHLIPTEKKVLYINQLLKVGFDTIDFGSFVSPKAIPQMADTKEVLSRLNLQGSKSKLLAIVANTRGAADASAFDEISYLGFPFSLSETFQLRNTNSTIEESLKTVQDIQNICLRTNKQLVVYLSMGFGNPYGDPYNEEILLRWADEMIKRGIHILSLADTVGVAEPEQISFAFSTLISKYPTVTVGVHLHSTQENWKSKLDAAINAGCMRVDGALKGIGGCPMAGNDLVGNMNMELIVDHLEERNLAPALDKIALAESLRIADEIFT